MAVGRLETATKSYILCLFGEKNYIFIWKKSGSFEKGCLWQP